MLQIEDVMSISCSSRGCFADLKRSIFISIVQGCSTGPVIQSEARVVVIQYVFDSLGT